MNENDKYSYYYSSGIYSYTRDGPNTPPDLGALRYLYLNERLDDMLFLQDRFH